MVGVVFYLRSLLGHLVRIRRWICNLTSTMLTTALVDNKCSMRATVAHVELAFRDLALPCDLPAAPTGVCVHVLSKDFPRASSMTLYNQLLSASPVCSILTCSTSTLLKYKSHSTSDSPTLILAGQSTCNRHHAQCGLDLNIWKSFVKTCQLPRQQPRQRSKRRQPFDVETSAEDNDAEVFKGK